MGTVASTLVIKTEGVSEGYKDIGKLLGPLQGINTMLYQLNKTLGITNKTSVKNGKTFSQLAKEGDAAAKSQLALQKQLRATAKACTSTSNNTKELAKSLKGINIIETMKFTLEVAKKIGQATKKAGEFAIDCLRAYQEQNPEAETLFTTVERIKQEWQAVKVSLGEMINTGVGAEFNKWLKSVDLIGGSIYAAFVVVSKIKLLVVELKNWGEIIIENIQDFFFTPFKLFAKSLSKALTVAQKIPFLAEKTKQSMGTAAELLTNFANMNADAIERDKKEIEKAKQKSKEEIEYVENLLLNRKRVIDKGVKDTTQNAVKQVKQLKEEIVKIGPLDDIDLGLTAEKLKADFEAALAATTAQYKAEREALLAASGSGSEFDDQARQELLLQKERDYQEQLKAIRLQYAQDTNDTQYLMQQELQDKIAALNQAQTEHWNNFANEIRTNLAKGALGELTGAAENLFDTMISGEELTREGAYEMMASMAKNIAKVGFQNLLSLAGELIMSSATSASKVPVIGPALAAAAMATFGGLTAALMAKYKPKQAQVQYANGGYISQGLVRGGAYGKDSVTAALMPGERVLSKKEAEEYDDGNVGAPIQNITINVSGQFNTPAQITQMVRQTIIPELRKATRAGLSIGA